MELTVKLTPTNLTTALRKGDVFVGEDLAPVDHVRLTRDGFENAYVYFTDGDNDILGLPSTVTVERKPSLTLWTYRTQAGMWASNADRPGFTAYEYAAGLVDSLGDMGGYAELFKIERYETDYETTGRNWKDVYTVIRSYGERPSGFKSVEEINGK